MGDFNELFDQWAASYDTTVYGSNHEYVEVFEHYDRILDRIVELSLNRRDDKVLEIGTGTGNLLHRFLQLGVEAIGIEPSTQMRLTALGKLPGAQIYDGTFLSLPLSRRFNAIVTSYAFHHLTWEEKAKAIEYLKGFLEPDGRLVIADTMFESPEYQQSLQQRVRDSGALKLLEDLQTEYYEQLNDIVKLLEEAGFQTEKEKINRYVWIVSAQLTY